MKREINRQELGTLDNLEKRIDEIALKTFVRESSCNHTEAICKVASLGRNLKLVSLCQYVQVSLIVELRGKSADDLDSVVKGVGRVSDESDGSLHVYP